MQPHTARARTTRRLALFSIVIIVLIALGWQSAPASSAGDRLPAMYLPLIDYDMGNQATATATATVTPSVTATATLTPSATATGTPTATATATATATGTPSQPVDLIGTAYVRPIHHILETSQPVAYIVVLDTSGSMNLNFDGEALDTDGVTKLQCAPSVDPAHQAKYEQDFTRCQQIDAMWLPKSERRIAILKAALMNFIDQLSTNDLMQIVASSSAHVGATTAGWEPGTPVGRQNLKDALLNAGKTANDPYQTSGGTTSATGLYQARQLLQSLPAQAPDGQQYRSNVLFLADGPANHFLSATGNPAGFGWYNDARDNPTCQNRWDLSVAVECQIGMTNTNPQIERPITAMITQAFALKQASTVHVVAVASVPGTELRQVASQATFPYYAEANTASMVTEQLNAIQSITASSSCAPSGGTAWLSDIDSAHTISDPAERARLGLPADTSVYGYAYLNTVNGEPLQVAPVRKNTQTGELIYSFPQVAAGIYTLQAFVAYRGDDQPTPVARSYNWILFPNLSHDTSRTFSLAPPQSVGTAVALEPLYLDLNGSVCN
jgi:hypothetical protein